MSRWAGVIQQSSLFYTLDKGRLAEYIGTLALPRLRQIAAGIALTFAVIEPVDTREQGRTQAQTSKVIAGTVALWQRYEQKRPCRANGGGVLCPAT